MPKISIIVPVYNSALFLERYLDSIINQTFQDFELILIEDGSDDKSPQICKHYQQKDRSIQLFYEQHSGQSVARNLGLTKSQGKYICFIDSDDYVTSDYLERLYEVIAQEKVDLVSCQMRGESYLKSLTPKESGKLTYFQTNDDLMAAYLQESPFSFGPVTKLYHRALLEGIYFSEHKIYEDYYFNYQYFSKISSAVAIDFVGYFYIQNQESTVRKSFDLRQLDNITEQHKVIKEVKEKYPEYLPIAAYNLAWGYYWIIIKCLALLKENKAKSKEYLKLIRNYLIDDQEILQRALALKTKREKWTIKMVKSCPNIIWWAYNIRFYFK